MNVIKCLSEEMKEPIIIQSVLRSLPMRFDPKISFLEERENLDMISMDELHEIFIADEMRTLHENPSSKEAFKESKKRKKKRHAKSKFRM
jgi:hypothetical protein